MQRAAYRQYHGVENNSKLEFHLHVMLKPRCRRPPFSSDNTTYSEEHAQREIDAFCLQRIQESADLYEKRKRECWETKLASLAQSAFASSAGRPGGATGGPSSLGGTMASSARGNSSATGTSGPSATGASRSSTTEKNKVAEETIYKRLAEQRITRSVIPSHRLFTRTRKSDFEEIWRHFGGTAQPLEDWCHEENFLYLSSSHVTTILDGGVAPSWGQAGSFFGGSYFARWRVDD